MTDTFQLSEGKGTLNEVMFPENNKRVIRQNKSDIRVILGNPPYSVGKESQNDASQNVPYPHLDDRIRQTYAELSSAALKRNAYDSYSRAFRWASDRIHDKGIVCFVSNGSLLGKNSMDGMRKSFANEFSSIYCFNLRGDAHTSGEERRREKGNVFGEGTKTSIAITCLVKNPEKLGNCRLYYHDIGDYLSREEKLAKVKEAASIKGIKWLSIVPNADGDWIHQRDPAFAQFIPLGDKSSKTETPVFVTYSLGLVTNRDAWAYNFSKTVVASNIKRMIDFYNGEVQRYDKAKAKSKDKEVPVEDVIDTNPTKIAWTRGLKAELSKLRKHKFVKDRLVRAMYRPFCKHWVYFDKSLNEMVLQMPRLFPNEKLSNLAICVVGPGARQSFSALMVNTLPDLHLSPDGVQCFPLFHFEKEEENDGQLFKEANAEHGYVRRDAISDDTLKMFRSAHSAKLTKEDIFYYVYGILHSPEYKERFGADLKKMLPRLPYVSEFSPFSEAGKALAETHVNYEAATLYPLKESAAQLDLNPKENYKVQKMIFGKTNGKEDKSIIIYNSNLTLSGIPLEAYGYVVKGKPALEWSGTRSPRTRTAGS